MKKKNMGRKTSLLLIGILVLIVFSGAFSVCAKYLVNWNGAKTAIKSEKFYFDSNLLSEAGECYKTHNRYIKINLLNYMDSKRINSADISFTIKVSGGKILKNLNYNPYANKTSEIVGSLTGNKSSRAEYYIYPDWGSDSVTVEASSISPYKKTLTCTIKFDNYKGITVQTMENDDNTISVFVQNDSFEGDVEFQVPSGIYPDNADPNGVFNDTQCQGASWNKQVSAGEGKCIQMDETYEFRFFNEGGTKEEIAVVPVEKN